MPITKKDGTIYQLRGPNKIMKDQEFWDTNNIKFINMKFKEEVVPDKGKTIVKLQPKEEIEIVEENLLIMPTKVIVEEPIIEQPIIEEPIVEQPIVEQPIVQQPKKLPETTIYCLPIVVREVEDSLYGEKYNVSEYGNKFSFQGIIVNDEDMFCKFWTKTKITKDSIIYPKNQSRRWWQVQEIEETDGGYLIMSTPTQVNPDFTD